MGMRFRKSVKLGPVRVNLSKSGVGYSVGNKFFRMTKKADGGVRRTTTLPGTGISHVEEISSEDLHGKRKTGGGKKPHAPVAILVAVLLTFGVVACSSAEEPADDTDNGAVQQEVIRLQEDQKDEVPVTDDDAQPEDDPPVVDELPAEDQSVEDDTPAVSETPNVSAAQKPDDSPAESSKPTQSTSRKVYRTKTGKKYHYDNNCNGGTYYEVTLEEAENAGLTPCKKCT